MTKICLLKVYILRTNLAFKELTLLSIESIMTDLRTWYGQLPDRLHIASMEPETLVAETRRSIYHIHLLYLGAIMLLYRRIASQFVRSYGQDKERDVLWKPLERLLHYAEEGFAAAKQSAHILALLLQEDGIFKRCWLVMLVGIFHGTYGLSLIKL
jgi:hypothetical protein